MSTFDCSKFINHNRDANVCLYLAQTKKKKGGSCCMTDYPH